MKKKKKKKEDERREKGKTEHIEKNPQTYRLTSRDGQVGVHGLFFLLSFFFLLLLFQQQQTACSVPGKKKVFAGKYFLHKGLPLGREFFSLRRASLGREFFLCEGPPFEENVFFFQREFKIGGNVFFDFFFSCKITISFEQKNNSFIVNKHY